MLLVVTGLFARTISLGKWNAVTKWAGDTAKKSRNHPTSAALEVYDRYIGWIPFSHWFVLGEKVQNYVLSCYLLQLTTKQRKTGKSRHNSIKNKDQAERISNNKTNKQTNKILDLYLWNLKDNLLQFCAICSFFATLKIPCVLTAHVNSTSAYIK